MRAIIAGSCIAFAVLILLGACAAADPVTGAYGRPTFAPTATRETTAVPLALTPVFTPRPLPSLPPLTDSVSSKPLALSGKVLVTANADSDSISIVDLKSEMLVTEIPLGDDPRSVAIVPGSTRAAVTLRGENALAFVDLAAHKVERVAPVCHMPYGVVADSRRAYVSCLGDDRIAVVEIETGIVLYHAPVPDAPAGLALSGEWLLATHFYSGLVTVVNVLRTPVVVGSVNVEPDGNLAQAIALSPDGRYAYVPQTRTGLALVSLQYMQDWFPTIGVFDVSAARGDRNARLTLSVLGGAVNMPFDAAFGGEGETLYVALAGSDAVAVVDLSRRSNISRIAVGSNPRGIVVDRDRAYVLNALDGTVSVIDIFEQRVVNSVLVTALPLDPVMLRGKMLFHQASPASLSDGAISCATCHFDGGADARTWINFRSGPRNTPALGGAAAMPPYNWAGDMTELHDTIEDQIRNVMLGDGLIASGEFDPAIDRIDSGRAADLDALAAYVAALEPWPSPYLAPDGSLTDSAQRGKLLFMSGAPNCGCHTPPDFTDLRQHNLAGASFSLETFGAFDTPTLRGLWATGPYMHDGVAQTLEEVLSRTDPVHSVAHRLTAQELADLIAYLLSL